MPLYTRMLEKRRHSSRQIDIRSTRYGRRKPYRRPLERIPNPVRATSVQDNMTPEHARVINPLRARLRTTQVDQQSEHAET